MVLPRTIIQKIKGHNAGIMVDRLLPRPITRENIRSSYGQNIICITRNQRMIGSITLPFLPNGLFLLSIFNFVRNLKFKKTPVIEITKESKNSNTVDNTSLPCSSRRDFMMHVQYVSFIFNLSHNLKYLETDGEMILFKWLNCTKRIVVV